MTGGGEGRGAVEQDCYLVAGVGTQAQNLQPHCQPVKEKKEKEKKMLAVDISFFPLINLI